MQNFERKKYGALDVDHNSSEILPNLAKVRFVGGSVSATPVSLRVVEVDVPVLFRLLDAAFEEGKRERSLEIQRTLNGGERNVSQHTIKLSSD